MTTRRTFLGAGLAAIAAAAAVDPDRQLWVPGRKVWSIPRGLGPRVPPLRLYVCRDGRMLVDGRDYSFTDGVITLKEATIGLSSLKIEVPAGSPPLMLYRIDRMYCAQVRTNDEEEGSL